MKIHKDQAEIKTCSVQIKSLMVDRRQLTMGTFRQLEDKPAITGTGKIIGKPWGRVNYFWKGLEGAVLHIVWQQGRYLYRSALPADIHALHPGCLSVQVTEERLGELQWDFEALARIFSLLGKDKTVVFRGGYRYLDIPGVRKAKWSEVPSQGEGLAIFVERKKLPTLKVCSRKLEMAGKKLEAARELQDRWEGSLTVLRKLEQLFIAT